MNTSTRSILCRIQPDYNAVADSHGETYNCPMSRFIAVLQLLMAVIIAVAAIANSINLILISTRPETISVVNAMIGQGVLIICMAAIANILFRKGLRALKSAGQPDSKSS